MYNIDLAVHFNPNCIWYIIKLHVNIFLDFRCITVLSTTVLSAQNFIVLINKYLQVLFLSNELHTNDAGAVFIYGHIWLDARNFWTYNIGKAHGTARPLTRMWMASMVSLCNHGYLMSMLPISGYDELIVCIPENGLQRSFVFSCDKQRRRCHWASYSSALPMFVLWWYAKVSFAFRKQYVWIRLFWRGWHEISIHTALVLSTELVVWDSWIFYCQIRITTYILNGLNILRLHFVDIRCCVIISGVFVVQWMIAIKFQILVSMNALEEYPCLDGIVLFMTSVWRNKSNSIRGIISDQVLSDI